MRAKRLRLEMATIVSARGEPSATATDRYRRHLASSQDFFRKRFALATREKIEGGSTTSTIRCEMQLHGVGARNDRQSVWTLVAKA